MSLPTSFRHREMKRSMMFRRTSWGGRLVPPWGPRFFRAMAAGPVGFLRFSLRGLKRVR
jgi:hypothetical protein